MRRSSDKPSLHHEVWESLGAQDPDWAVLTDPGRRHGGWGDDLDAFYSSGRAEISAIVMSLPTDARHDRAIDWGSGTGRLTFALLERFGEVTAVDVSQSMLATLTNRAQELGEIDRMTPTLLTEVRPAGDHDLAVSLLVLQHLGTRTEVTEALRTLVACVRVGGHVVVEIPDRAKTLKARIQPRFRAYSLLRGVGLHPTTLHRHRLSGISMRCLPQQLVRATLLECGAEVIGVPVERSDGGHRYVRYVAQRRR